MDENPTNQAMDIGLVIEAAEGDRWRVRVDVRPLGAPVSVMGATVALLDVSEELIGPAVVLPLAGALSDRVTVYARVPAPTRCLHPSLLRCTVFFTDCFSPLVVDRPIERPIGFGAYVRGENGLGLGTAPPGRSLSDTEYANLKSSFPWLITDEDIEAFEAFSKDFSEDLGLGGDKDVTEEILRMLREECS